MGKIIKKLSAFNWRPCADLALEILSAFLVACLALAFAVLFYSLWAKQLGLGPFCTAKAWTLIFDKF